MSKELKEALKKLIKDWIKDFKKRKDISVNYFGDNKYIINDLIKKEFKKGGII